MYIDKFFLIRFLLFSLLFIFNCSSEQISLDNKDEVIKSSDFIEKKGISKDIINSIQFKKREKIPTAIVLHSSDNYTVKEFFENSIKSNFFFHIFIDKSGNIYRDPYLKTKEYRLIPKMDNYSIHIVLEGNEDEILSNQILFNKALEVIQKISKKYSIPLDNKNIASEKGIFTHTQAKKKYGNFVDMRDCGGEKVLFQILTKLGSKYSPESEWVDRYSKEWTFRKEDTKSIKSKEEFTNGRGITENPIAILENIEKTSDKHIIEDYRVKYVFDQLIQPTCIVLHYTAISDFKVSLKVLEDRRVNASIMVDKDGKAYQLLDYLTHSPRSAGGTNHACVQIEIVGKNTEELLKNEIQTNKVIQIVKELSLYYNVPITNQKIESMSGIFSHTQAKKKFGRSVALIGKDFDPGEEYMKKVIEALGSKYYPEEEWYDRKSEDWIILYGDFQP